MFCVAGVRSLSLGLSVVALAVSSVVLCLICLRVGVGQLGKWQSLEQVMGYGVFGELWV